MSSIPIVPEYPKPKCDAAQAFNWAAMDRNGEWYFYKTEPCFFSDLGEWDDANAAIRADRLGWTPPPELKRVPPATSLIKLV